MNNYQSLHNDFEFATPTDKKLSMLMYIFGFLTWIVGPLIIFYLFREHSSYFVKRGKEFFNFQFSYIVYIFLLSFATGDFPPLILIIIILVIMMHVFYIIGAIKMKNGEKYIAPLSLRLFK